MVRALLLALVLLTCHCPAASVGYISFGNNAQNTANLTNLTSVFGAPSSTTWQSLGGGNLSGSLTGYSFLFVDGGTAGGNTFRDWLNSNLTAVQNYVAAGGRLYIDSGRTSGTNTINAGFGGVQFARMTGPSANGNTGVAVDPTDPIFANGAGTSWSASGNNDFASDYVIAPPGVGTPLITDQASGRTLLLEQTWGNGMAWFGGFDATSMRPGSITPTSVLFQNMLQYMANTSPPNPGVPEPDQIALLIVGVLGLLALHRRRSMVH